MKIVVEPERSKWEEIITRPTFEQAKLTETVSAILNEVKSEGDSALKRLASKYDQFNRDQLELSEKEWDDLCMKVDGRLKQAIDNAYQNIRTFHASQAITPMMVETTPGVTCWQEFRPIERVGLYIPGGSAPLVSTVLMLCIPAQISGCDLIELCTPCGPESIHPAIAYAAKLCGVHKLYLVGGAQAIAAMAYGTETIPKVDKIFGPGNQYVTRAKELVQLDGVAIDMAAGPSEVLVYGDDQTNPAWCAADLLAQAEHGPDSQVVLLATSEIWCREVLKQIIAQLPELPRREICKKALENSLCVVINETNHVVDFINAYAPEHLILASQNAHEIAEKIKNAGSVFVGPLTPESAGDYASGTNHTLPTNFAARAFSGVTLQSFQKSITFQSITLAGLQNLEPTITELASAEGLQAHARAVSIRIEQSK